MKVFWFTYSGLMCAPAILVAYMYYSIAETGSCLFYEYDLLIRNIEMACAFTFALVAIVGWVISGILLFKRNTKEE